MEYFNGAADTPMGELRAKNGHPEPYRIKYWQVGNERSGADYEARLADVLQGDEGGGPVDHAAVQLPDARACCRQAGDQLGYVCPHQYDCADLAGVRAGAGRRRAS